jgi:hypothetical protein
LTLRYEPHRLLLMITLFLFAISLACGPVGGGSPALPTPPGGSVQVSPDAAERLKTRLRDSLQQNTSGDVILRFTNEEITSYVTLELQQQGGQAPFSDPQIWFTSGKIFITGTVKGVLPVDVPATIVATAIAENQRIEFEIEKTSMGPLPFPQDLLDSISQSVNETIYESIDPRVEVSRLEILEGEMVIVLRRPQQPTQ